MKEKTTQKGVRMRDERRRGWKIKHVQYAIDKVLKEESREDLQYILDEF